MSSQKIRPDRSVLANLASLGEMRAWSVIITIFGDAVAPRGGSVASITLQTILEKYSIKPEAMRVALHRLVKDGWIERQKTGRQSFYALSAKGRAEFLAATRRIYADAPALSGPWKVIVAQSQKPEMTEKLTKLGFIAISGTAFLGHSDTPKTPSDVISVSGTDLALPKWARSALGPQSLTDDYARLETAIHSVEATHITDPLDAVALRILMIHHWRRILLRHPDLPASLFAPNWRGELCRKLVLTQHDRLSRLADPWLDRQIGARTTTTS